MRQEIQGTGSEGKSLMAEIAIAFYGNNRPKSAKNLVFGLGGFVFRVWGSSVWGLRFRVKHDEFLPVPRPLPADCLKPTATRSGLPVCAARPTQPVVCPCPGSLSLIIVAVQGLGFRV